MFQSPTIQERRVGLVNCSTPEPSEYRTLLPLPKAILTLFNKCLGMSAPLWHWILVAFVEQHKKRIEQTIRTNEILVFTAGKVSAFEYLSQLWQTTYHQFFVLHQPKDSSVFLKCSGNKYTMSYFQSIYQRQYKSFLSIYKKKKTVMGHVSPKHIHTKENN